MVGGRGKRGVGHHAGVERVAVMRRMTGFYASGVKGFQGKGESGLN